MILDFQQQIQLILRLLNYTKLIFYNASVNIRENLGKIKNIWGGTNEKK